jgi:hypothetical protein
MHTGGVQCPRDLPLSGHLAIGQEYDAAVAYLFGLVLLSRLLCAVQAARRLRL